MSEVEKLESGETSITMTNSETENSSNNNNNNNSTKANTTTAVNIENGLTPEEWDRLPSLPIVEPQYEPEEKALIDEMRKRIHAHVDEYGYRPHHVPTLPISRPWREAYTAYAHLTTIKITPDPVYTTKSALISSPSEPPKYDESVPTFPPSLKRSNWLDCLFHRFLVARKMDLDKAVEMFLFYLYFRDYYGVDDLYAQQPMPFADIIHSIVCHRIHGIDRNGQPLYFQMTGQINPHEFVTRVPDEVLVMTHVHFVEEMCEKLQKTSEKLGRRCLKIVNTIDTEGVGLAHRKTLKFFQLTTFVDQNFYPDMLGKFYMVNAPSIVPALFAITKVFMDSVTQQKIHILGAGDYQQKLRDDLGERCLPKIFGGTCECPNGCLPELTSQGNEIDEDSEELVKQLESGKTFEKYTIRAGSAFDVPIKIERQQQQGDSGKKNEEKLWQLWWSFEVVNKDIDFSVVFTPNSTAHGTTPAAHTIFSKTRLSTSPAPFRGVHTFEENAEGVVKLKWDNSYSTFSSKDVKIVVGLRPIDVNIDSELAKLKFADLNVNL